MKNERKPEAAHDPAWRQLQQTGKSSTAGGAARNAFPFTLTAGRLGDDRLQPPASYGTSRHRTTFTTLYD